MTHGLAHARIANQLLRIGDFARWEAPVLCVEPVGRFDNAFDEGQTMFTPNASYGSPQHSGMRPSLGGTLLLLLGMNSLFEFTFVDPGVMPERSLAALSDPAKLDQCHDSAAYRDRHGFGCAGWATIGCREGNHPRANTSGTCTDDATFRDSYGGSCSDWAKYDCGAFPGYDASAMEHVRQNCPVSCGGRVHRLSPHAIQPVLYFPLASSNS